MSIWIEEDCSLCGYFINQTETGEPCIKHKQGYLCSRCAIDLIEPIYTLLGMGGIQHLIFKDMLSCGYNKKKRPQIRNYRKTFKELMCRYNFQCIHCGEKDVKKLAVDHIKPVSKGGTDEIKNLQILCKICNSRKGVKYEVV